MALEPAGLQRSTPLCLLVDCKSAIPMKGRGSAPFLDAHRTVAYTRSFRETCLNNRQVRRAGAILENVFRGCNPEGTGTVRCLWKNGEIRETEKAFHRWTQLSLRA